MQQFTSYDIILEFIFLSCLTMQLTKVHNKNAFQWDAYHPLQWPSRREGGVYLGGCLSKGGVYLGTCVYLTPVAGQTLVKT